jgi:non-ribosomal peptide synthetase component F
LVGLKLEEGTFVPCTFLIRSYDILSVHRYRGRDDLTASRFATHPELDERLYRTGDRGKLLPDGSVLLIGRIDREVKVRGKIHI